MDAGSRSTRSKFGQRLLFGLALLPFGTGIAAHLHARAIGSSAQPNAVRSPRAAVVFDQYLVDLGRAKDAPLLYGWFRFRNTSEGPIRVVDLRPSCGCLNPQLEKRDYAPGEVGEFYVRVQTANESAGPHEYTVGFDYVTADSLDVDGGEPITETLTFRMTLPERKISIEPRGLAFYQLDGNASTREIVVRDFRPERLRILRATCASELVSVELGETTDASNHRAQTIHVTVAGTVPPGTAHETILMHTDDPTHPTLRFPLLIRGPETTGVIPAGHEEQATENDTEALGRQPEITPVGGERQAP